MALTSTSSNFIAPQSCVSSPHSRFDVHRFSFRSTSIMQSSSSWYELSITLNNFWNLEMRLDPICCSMSSSLRLLMYLMTSSFFWLWSSTSSACAWLRMLVASLLILSTSSSSCFENRETCSSRVVSTASMCSFSELKSEFSVAYAASSISGTKMLNSSMTSYKEVISSSCLLNCSCRSFSSSSAVSLPTKSSTWPMRAVSAVEPECTSAIKAWYRSAASSGRMTSIWLMHRAGKGRSSSTSCSEFMRMMPRSMLRGSFPMRFFWLLNSCQSSLNDSSERVPSV
mmetsp:Transcript_35166/g.59258  ORF Transcript_35166/g.59258 Transcript_35166/m.59258 type:complete len:284 (-) Transcript_35166:619-1470(-)